VGTANGNAWFFGFRPRDDQSASLGYETRSLFEILNQAGAYPSTGAFTGINDNTEYVSRNSDYLATRFPNGATVLVRHYRRHRENWGSGNSRDKVADSIDLAANPLPTDEIILENFRVNGHELSFQGRLTMAFMCNEKNELIAFDGEDCKQVTIDGSSYQFSDEILHRIAFAPALDKENSLEIYIEGGSSVTIPLFAGIDAKSTSLVDADGNEIKYKIGSIGLQLKLNSRINGKWLTLSW